MADVKESALTQQSDCKWVRALDSNGNSIKISKEDLASVVGGLLQNSETFKAPNAAKVEGAEYVLDLQAGFFSFDKTLYSPNNGSKWYAKATIPSTGGWAGSASFYIYASMPNKDFRLKIFIPIVSIPSKYEGYGALYGTPLAVEAFAIVFNSDDRATVYFKFNESTTNASIKCSHKDSTFEIVEEPSNVNWIPSDGLHNTLK